MNYTVEIDSSLTSTHGSTDTGEVIPWDGIANPFWSPKIFAVWREAWALSLAPCLHCHFLCIFMPAVFCRVVAGGFEMYQHGYTSHSFPRMNSRSPFTAILSVVIVECPFGAVFQPGLLTSGAFQPQAPRGKCQPISAATSRALQISTVATWTFFFFFGSDDLSDECMHESIFIGHRPYRDLPATLGHWVHYLEFMHGTALCTE